MKNRTNTLKLLSIDLVNNKMLSIIKVELMQSKPWSISYPRGVDNFNLLAYFPSKKSIKLYINSTNPEYTNIYEGICLPFV